MREPRVWGAGVSVVDERDAVLAVGAAVAERIVAVLAVLPSRLAAARIKLPPRDAVVGTAERPHARRGGRGGIPRLAQPYPVGVDNGRLTEVVIDIAHRTRLDA